MTGYVVHNEGYQPDDDSASAAYNRSFDPEGGQSNGSVAKETKDGGEEEVRQGWGNKFEFVLAIVGYAVGLGNVWRFPYLAQKNGGGAFLIPYILSLAFMGIPVFYMELAIGQRLRRGPLHVWNKLSPYLAGVGLSSVVVSFLVGCYYNMIVAWCFYYLFISFQAEVPYAKCPCEEGFSSCNETYGMVEECALSSPTTYFWYRGALDTTSGIDDSGVFNWKLALCLLLAWILIFGITCKGTESMGKAVYFTAIFPYVVLIIFFVRAMMLEGASDGIKHMFTPDFEALTKAEVWLDASTQIFYSLGLAFGGLISMASYNEINNNIVRDALLVSVVNCGTSIFGGVTIFGILGYKATVNYKHCLTKQPLDNRTCDLKTFLDDVAQGPGLTFIAFTEAMSTMDVTQLWSVMFFMMTLTLGIGTMLGTYEAVRTTVIDLKIIPLRKELVSLILCLVSFLFGLLFCQGSGQYWLDMFNSFAANIGLLTISLFEVIIIMYIYGIKKFEKDIEFMLGKKPNWYWKSMWLFVTPGLTVLIIFASFYSLAANGIKYIRWDPVTATTFLDDYPNWAKGLCILLIAASVIFIPITALLVNFDLFKIPSDESDDKKEMDNEMRGIPNSSSQQALANHMITQG
eukprot:TCONS_00017112-protein